MPDPRTVVTSAARTASGDSGAISLSSVLVEARRGQHAKKLSLLVDVTAVGGVGPTMTVTVEWSHDGSTFAAVDGTADSFAAMPAVGAKVKEFTIKAPYYRIAWAIGGTTPLLTFSVAELVI